MKIKGINKWTLISGFLFLILAVSVVTGGFGFGGIFGSSSDEIGKKTMDYVNNNLLPPGTTASLIESKKGDSGIFEVKFKLGEQEITSFVTQDGKMLFPTGYEMNEAEAVSKDADAKEAEKIPARDKADVKLFVMSYCPYGNQAEDSIRPVVDLLGNKADIELRYVISKNGDKYKSLHGDKELDQNVREMCVQKYASDKFWDFIKEMNEKSTIDNAQKKWEGIAQGLSIDVDKIKECAKSEKNSLLDEDSKLTDKYEVRGSPTLVVNDVAYKGDATSEAYKEAICSGFKEKPDVCDKKLSEEGGSVEGGCAE